MFKLVGVDLYLRSDSVPELPRESGKFTLTFISNRGTKIWPPPAPAIALSDWLQCRFESTGDITDADAEQLLQEISQLGFHWTKAQKLYTKDGEKQYSQPY
ncbi:MAG: Isocitrate dehydrogenase [NADP] [Fimbriimonadales bacterium]|nr:MAG: isocitrate dehydrogenase [Armatimonadota bacterium]MBV6502473.1 Isocitrate dehydrogenase [NADP] [Fimbriimonadales bacterium]MCE7898686.1 isocitrate dehydrogenase [Armatimonadetes bacterium ATM1]MDL1928021.1 isocitrate dehydrogenase [Fimbriimonadia bacterium ATM]MBC6968475.1 isocitrate dehydrogenase [Armatimonadota bacterium]